MARIPINIGGGASATSDDCTATLADVLTGRTAVTNDSDDEAVSGTMKDYSGTTTTATVTNNSSSARVELTVPNTGKYDTAAKLYTPYSTLASAVSLTASKLATGQSVLGISGSYTGVGTATASQVLSGYTFSNASSSGISGSMSDRSGTTSSATSSLDSSNSRVRLQIPSNGYYNTSAYLYQSYSNIASLIGLTAAKVVSGNTILGIAGTASEYTDYVSSGNGYNVYPGNLSNDTWYISNGASGYNSVTARTITLSVLGYSSLSFTPTYMFILTDNGYAGIYYTTGCNFAGGTTSRNGSYPASANSAYSLTKTSINVPCYFSSSSTTTATLIWFWIIGTK